jgi:effector-binding domain-containing protein
LTEIAEILAAGTPAEVRAAVERHRQRVMVRAGQLDRIVARLDAVLEDPLRMPDWLHVYERWRDAQPIARMLVHTSLTGLAETLGPGFARLLGELAQQGIAPVGPPGTRYLSDDLDAPELVVELFVPVERALRPAGPVEAGQLPSCLLAATVHEGGYDDVDTAYRSLGRWIADHDRALDGPAEELYLVPPGPACRRGRTARRSPGRSAPSRGGHPQPQTTRPNDHQERVVCRRTAL